MRSNRPVEEIENELERYWQRVKERREQEQALAAERQAKGLEEDDDWDTGAGVWMRNTDHTLQCLKIDLALQKAGLVFTTTQGTWHVEAPDGDKFTYWRSGKWRPKRKGSRIYKSAGVDRFIATILKRHQSVAANHAV